MTLNEFLTEASDNELSDLLTQLDQADQEPGASIVAHEIFRRTDFLHVSAKG